MVAPERNWCVKDASSVKADCGPPPVSPGPLTIALCALQLARTAAGSLKERLGLVAGCELPKLNEALTVLAASGRKFAPKPPKRLVPTPLEVATESWGESVSLSLDLIVSANDSVIDDASFVKGIS